MRQLSQKLANETPGDCGRTLSQVRPDEQKTPHMHTKLFYPKTETPTDRLNPDWPELPLLNPFKPADQTHKWFPKSLTSHRLRFPPVWPSIVQKMIQNRYSRDTQSQPQTLSSHSSVRIDRLTLFNTRTHQKTICALRTSTSTCELWENQTDWCSDRTDTSDWMNDDLTLRLCVSVSWSWFSQLWLNHDHPLILMKQAAWLCFGVKMQVGESLSEGQRKG